MTSFCFLSLRLSVTHKMAVSLLQYVTTGVNCYKGCSHSCTSPDVDRRCKEQVKALMCYSPQLKSEFEFILIFYKDGAH